MTYNSKVSKRNFLIFIPVFSKVKIEYSNCKRDKSTILLLLIVIANTRGYAF